MVDFGANQPERPVAELVTKKLRPGDIYTHVYSGLRNEQDEAGKVNPGLWEGRKRGVIFDVGHGGGSFAWRVAVPAVKEGFLPDSISTDLHVGSMNAGMKDMLNVMSKFLALGLTLDDVVRARDLEPGARDQAGASSATCRWAPPPTWRCCASRRASFGFVDSFGARLRGHAEARLRDDAARRQGRLRPERPRAPGLGDAAPGLPSTGDPRWEREPAGGRSHGEVESERLPEEGARGGGGRGRRGHDGRTSAGAAEPADAGEEGPLVRRQAAGEDAAVQRHRVLRQPGLHLRHRRPLRGRHQGPHETRPRRDPEAAGDRRLLDGEGPQGERLPERPEGLRGDERGVPGPLRPRAGRADHDRAAGGIPGNSLVEIDCIACI